MTTNTGSEHLRPEPRFKDIQFSIKGPPACVPQKITSAQRESIDRVKLYTAFMRYVYLDIEARAHEIDGPGDYISVGLHRDWIPFVDMAVEDLHKLGFEAKYHETLTRTDFGVHFEGADLEVGFRSPNGLEDRFRGLAVHGPPTTPEQLMA